MALAVFALNLAVLIILPPFLFGVIAKTKAFVAGRDGQPLLQAYFDLFKLLRKGAVYSRTATWVFRAGPIVSLASVLAAGALLPLVGPSPIGFSGDVVVFASLLALGRFFTMAAALDVGSSFEGMGASREAAFGALTEPALFLVLAVACVATGSTSFSEVFAATRATWGTTTAAFLVAAVALFGIALAENARMPVDDPATHLELTMIHEVMVLDHGGPDFAFIVYGASVKLFLFAALLVQLALPRFGPVAALPVWQSLAILLGGALTFAVLVGIVESLTARLRLVRVPQFLIGAGVLAALCLVVLFHRGPA